MAEIDLKEEYGFDVMELQKNLKDRKWRLNNLYFVRDASGNKVLFKMNPVQEYIHDNLWFYTIIPKARQLGVTTFFTILYFDQILFSDNKMATIIAHRQEDMKKIFKDKIKFAWDNLHPWLKFMIGEPDSNNANELSFPNGSTINTALSTRSGTVQFLHISEFPYICQRFPERAEEIVTGALNSVHSGNMVSIEGTSAGMEGYFYQFCQKAEELRLSGAELTAMDFKIMFFPWWIDKKYTLDGNVVINEEYKKYFELLKSKSGIDLSEGQKKWYVKKKETQGDNMFKEFPSTLEECFKAVVEGAYYGKWMNKAYLGQRIGKVDTDGMRKVDTYWDLGINDSCVILFVQQVGWRINFIDCYSGSGEGLAHYVKEIEERTKKNGWRLGKHVFPWDVDTKDVGSGLTRKETLIQQGLTNIVVAPKLGIADGIEKVRGMFSRFVFDETKCKPLIAGLTNYRKEWDEKAGVWKDKPKHDENSHWCFSADTPVLTPSGYKNICEIKIGDEVITPTGVAKVLNNTFNEQKDVVNFAGMKVTPDHPFLTQRGFCALDAVRVGDKLAVWKNKQLSSVELNSADTLNQTGASVGFIFPAMIRSIKGKLGYIDTSTNGNMEKSPRVKLSTIKMVTLLIIKSITSWSRLGTSISVSIIVKKMQSVVKGLSRLLLFLQKNGTPLNKEDCGTNNKQETCGKMALLKKLKWYVKIVKITILLSIQTDRNTVQKNVNLKVVGKENVYNLQTSDGMYIAGDFVVSNCDPVRVLATTWVDSEVYGDQEQNDEVERQRREKDGVSMF